MGFYFSLLIGAIARFIAVALVLAWITPGVGGCGGCKYDEEELPVVLCEPVPSGSPGCIGLPDGTSTKTYPLYCEVVSATAGPSCGYSHFGCSAAPGREKYAWVTGN